MQIRQKELEILILKLFLRILKILKLQNFSKKLAYIPSNATVNAPVNEPVNAPVKLNNTQKLIIKLMKENNQITQIELSRELKVNESTIKRNISKLRDRGMLRRIGSDKSEYWEILVN